MDYTAFKFGKPPKREKRKGREKLDSKAYAALRKACWRAARGRCEACGDDAPLTGHPLAVGHLHHKVFRSHGGDDSAENSSWLCGPCHRKIHDGDKPVPKKGGN